MSEKKKSSFKAFLAKYIFTKPKEETQTPKQFLFSALGCVLIFICLTIFKLPYNEENAPLLNCYYGLFFVFAVACFFYHTFSDNADAQKRILPFLKIIAAIICCFGVYLFILYFDYIDAHISEWGSFNKVR